MTSDEAPELTECLKDTLMFSKPDNVSMSIVVQIFEKLPGILDEKKCVAENVFVSVNKLLETEKEIIEECERSNNSATR